MIVAFIIAVNKKQLKGRVGFGSRFEDTVYHCREGMAAEAGSRLISKSAARLVYIASSRSARAK